MTNQAIRRTDKTTIEALRRYGVATIHEAQSQTGLLHPDLRPIFSDVQVAGRAVTVLAHAGDNLAIHTAIPLCKPDDVLVVALADDETDTAYGMFGELLGTSCLAHGISALVIDSGVRDIRQLTELNFPVWSRAVSARGTIKQRPGAVNVPILCAGQWVEPGDVVVADDDGVVIVSSKCAEQVMAAAENREKQEAALRERLVQGELTLDLLNLRETLDPEHLKTTNASQKKTNRKDVQ